MGRIGGERGEVGVCYVGRRIRDRDRDRLGFVIRGLGLGLRVRQGRF